MMKEIKIKEQKKESESWVLPGKSLSQDEFLAGIRKAEKGPFHTVQESMENFELWLKSRAGRCGQKCNLFSNQEIDNFVYL